MKFKSEASQKFQEYVAEEGAPRKIRSVNEKEYKSKDFVKFCFANKIKQEYTVPETQEQNGLAERYNRTLAATTRCFLRDNKLPKIYWVGAMATANDNFNRITNEKSKKAIKRSKIFGCTAYMQRRRRQRSKLAPRGLKCKFLGNDERSPAYLVQVVDSGKINFARNVIFNDDESPEVTHHCEETDSTLRRVAHQCPREHRAKR